LSALEFRTFAPRSFLEGDGQVAVIVAAATVARGAA
jgi:hypothetical protein